MRPTQLAVFDFDKTLFRSPERPDTWTMGWWGRAESLGDPCVPDVPGPDWWNEEIVAVAREQIEDPDVLAVLLTGRLKKRFEGRVAELLAQAELDFDEVLLAPGGGTLQFKLAAVRRILSERPEIDSVSVWDDREEHLPEFGEMLEQLGVRYRLFLVEIEPHVPLCD